MNKILIKTFLISLISLICLICMPSLFANNFNVGIGLVVPLGASISQKNQTHNADADKNDGIFSGKSAFEVGVGITPGFYKGFNDFMGFSIALDFGYKREVFSYSQNKKIADSQYETVSTIYYFDTINLGLLPKFNVASFFIGIGGGVKIVVNGVEKIKNYGENHVQLKSPYIPYVKATFDYLFLFGDEMALGIGLYAGYDFGPHAIDSRFSKNILSAFDIGGQISFYFVNN